MFWRLLSCPGVATTSSIIAILGGTVAIIGGSLSIITWSLNRKLLKIQLAEKDKLKMEEADDNAVFETLMQNAEGMIPNRIWKPPLGSSIQRIMERLVDKGKLKKNAFGAYQIEIKRD